ncbi:MAG: Crp/Fnr family transcriptional regulator [Pseudomonadota bacterium]
MTPTEREFLRSSKFLSEFSEETADAIVKASVMKEFADREAVQKKGKKGDGIFVVLSGALIFSTVSASGDEVSVGCLRPGDWAGDLSSIDGGGRTHDAHAIGLTRVAWLNTTRISELSLKFPDFYRILINMLCYSVRATYDEFDKILMFSTEQMLAWRISYFFENVQKGEEIPLRQDDMAALVGVSRQTINSILRRWSAEGIIETRYGHIQLHNPKKLRAMFN